MTTRFHRGDLPADYQPGPSLAIDTETLGLNPHRDRLCVVQISKGDGDADVVQILKDGPAPTRLIQVLADESVLKIFHYGRFDLAVLFHAFGVMPRPVYCTKIASRLVRTYTDRHGLKDLCRELLGIDMSKQQQSSDWGADALTPGPDRLRGLRCSASPRAERETRPEPGAREPSRRRPSMLRVPAHPRAAGPARMA